MGGEEKGAAEHAGGVKSRSQEELRELLQGLHLQGLLLNSCPRCHRPQLLPIIRCTHFLSKPNGEKEETHITISLLPPRCPPPLQISRFIFLDLNQHIQKDAAF